MDGLVIRAMPGSKWDGRINCPSCDGTGVEQDECPNCSEWYDKDCEICDGKGIVVFGECPYCDGKGTWDAYEENCQRLRIENALKERYGEAPPASVYDWWAT